MSDAERWDQVHAEQLVATITGGLIQRRDVAGAPPGTHDFDVALPDGRLIAVEVTRCTDAQELQLQAEVARRTWSCSALASGWYLSVHPWAEVASLHAERFALLSCLEQAGISRLYLDGFRATGPVDDATLQAAIDRFRQLGVFAVLQPPGMSAGQVIVAGVEPADWTSPEVITEAIEAAIGRKRATIGRMVADERHLFLWVELSQRRVIQALGFVDLPEEQPHLPDSLDAVWLIEARYPCRVLVYRRVGGWTDHGTYHDGNPLFNVLDLEQ